MKLQNSSVGNENRQTHSLDSTCPNRLVTVSEGITTISQATNIPSLLEPFAHILMQLYRPEVVEIMLRTPTSSTLDSCLTVQASGSRHTCFARSFINPIVQGALRRGKITKAPVSWEASELIDGMTELVLAPIGEQIPEGVVILGFMDTAFDLDEEKTTISILTHNLAIKLLQLHHQEQLAQKNAELMLMNQISKAVAFDNRNEHALSDVLWLVHRSLNLCNLSLYVGPLARLRLSVGGEPVTTGTQRPEGLAVLAFQEERTLFSSDVSQDPRCQIPDWVGERAQSEVALPIFRQHRCVGVIDMFSPELHAFHTQDLQILNTLGNQIVMLLEEETLFTTTGHLTAVVKEAMPAPGAVDLRDLPGVNPGENMTQLDAITRAARMGLHADAVTLYKVHNGRLLHTGFQSASDVWTLHEKQTLHLALEAFERHLPVWTGTSMNLPDSLQGKMGVPATQRIDLDGRAIAVPVGAPGSELGIMVLGFQGDKLMDPSIVGAIEGLASLTAFTLQASELSVNYQRQKERLALLYEIAIETRKLSSPTEVAMKTIQSVREGMGWAQVELYRWDERAGGLVLYSRPEKSPFVVPMGEGLVGTVAGEKRLLVRTPEDNILNPDSDQGVHGEMAVPLMVEDHLRGVLYARSEPGHAFTIEEQSILSAVAELLADTLDTVTLYVRLRHQLQEATTLYHITRSLNNTDNLDNALDEVVNVIGTALDARDTRISLLDDEKKLLVTKASSDHEESIPLVDAAFSDSLAQEDPLYTVASTGTSIIIDDMQSRGNGIFMQNATRSLLAVPMISSKGEIIGTLSVSSDQPYAFSRVDEHLLTVAGGQVAVVIENIALYKDIEKRRKHLRFAYNRLRELTELKDQILQNVSHEIRTPLTLIKGYVELIREDGIGGELTPSQRQAIDTISRRADDVVRIVGQIVALQPLNDLSADRTQVSVGKLLQEVVDVFTHMITGTQLTLHLHPVDAELCFDGDYEKIRQLCYNILDNSVKFSPNGGTVSIRAVSEEDYVHMTFADQGIGIDAHRLSRIFETFFQIDGSSTRRFGGLGLGLAVVNRVVESHHGKVWVESELNKGSIFHVLLPQYKAEG
ncbi:MAG: GAF domain-containing protein [Anaerolineae bacterium]|nr:GAF domain-containing protein [Anaerolineae bacterium]